MTRTSLQTSESVRKGREGSSRRPGELQGAQAWQRAINGFLITDERYAPRQLIHRHDHEHASFCVVLAGAYDETFGRKTRRLEPGRSVIHPAGEHHAERHDPVAARVLVIEVDAERLATIRSATSILDGPLDFVDRGIVSLAGRLMAEAKNTDGASNLAVESVVLEMLARADRSNTPETRRPAWLSRVRDYLDAHGHSGPSLDGLAAIAAVHPVHLARSFRLAFGCTIGGYVRRMQVERTIVLLQRLDLTLSQVALEAGFGDQSHLTRLFRRQTGTTPGAWRRAYRGTDHRLFASDQNVSDVQDV